MNQITVDYTFSTWIIVIKIISSVFDTSIAISITLFSNGEWSICLSVGIQEHDLNAHKLRYAV